MPSLIHNFRTSREWIPVSAHTGLNIYMGNNPASEGYEQVTALDARHAKAWFALAILHRDQGETEPARQALTEAARLVGWDHPEIVKFLSRPAVMNP